MNTTRVKAPQTKQKKEPEYRIEDFLMNLGDLSLHEIVGQDEAIAELKNLVHAIQYEPLYKHWSLPIPKGILLSGPTRVGKTASVRALARKLGSKVTLMELRYLDIASRWVDMPIEQLRRFFEIAEQQATQKHVIIFIDEIDAMLPARDSQLHETSMKRVNVFLEWMDGGFSSLNNITVIGATNYIDGLDKAVKQPGRFDKIIKFNELTPDDLLKAFEIHIKKRKLESSQLGNIDFSIVKPLLKKGTLSGGDVPEIINRLINNKVNEHRQLLEGQIEDLQSKTDEELAMLVKQHEPYPRPISSSDFYKATKDFIDNKIKVGNLSKTGLMGFVSEVIEEDNNINKMDKQEQ